MEETTTTWYRLNKYTSGGDKRIEAVEVEKETEHFVVVKSRHNGLNRRAAKSGSAEWYFRTWQEAKEHWVAYVQTKYDVAKAALERATSDLKEAQELQP